MRSQQHPLRAVTVCKLVCSLVRTLVRTLLALTAAPLALAAGDNSSHAAHSTVAAPANAAMSNGEVRKIDLAQGKVTLKHGEIKHLDMPGMTMVFSVQNKAQLQTLKPGDQVKCMVVSAQGKLLVTEIAPAR